MMNLFLLKSTRTTHAVEDATNFQSVISQPVEIIFDGQKLHRILYCRSLLIYTNKQDDVLLSNYHLCLYRNSQRKKGEGKAVTRKTTRERESNSVLSELVIDVHTHQSLYNEINTEEILFFFLFFFFRRLRESITRTKHPCRTSLSFSRIDDDPLKAKEVVYNRCPIGGTSETPISSSIENVTRK